MIEFALPDVGEGLTEAEIVAWHVVVGDTVDINETLVDIETAKSIVELPSPAAGVVVAVHVDEGRTVDVGTVLVSIDDGVAGVIDVSSPIPTAEGSSADGEIAEKPLVLVGTAPTEAAPRRRRLTRVVTQVPHAIAAAAGKPVARNHRFDSSQNSLASNLRALFLRRAISLHAQMSS